MHHQRNQLSEIFNQSLVLGLVLLIILELFRDHNWFFYSEEKNMPEALGPPIIGGCWLEPGEGGVALNGSLPKALVTFRLCRPCSGRDPFKDAVSPAPSAEAGLTPRRSGRWWSGVWERFHLPCVSKMARALMGPQSSAFIWSSHFSRIDPHVFPADPIRPSSPPPTRGTARESLVVCVCVCGRSQLPIVSNTGRARLRTREQAIGEHCPPPQGIRHGFQWDWEVVTGSCSTEVVADWKCQLICEAWNFYGNLYIYFVKRKNFPPKQINDCYVFSCPVSSANFDGFCIVFIFINMIVHFDPFCMFIILSWRAQTGTSMFFTHDLISETKKK